MWIKAVEQRPERSGNVLCFTKSGSTLVIYYDAIADAFNVHYNDLCEYDSEIAVKYWKPIEKLPTDRKRAEAYRKYRQSED